MKSLDPTTFQPSISCSGPRCLPHTSLDEGRAIFKVQTTRNKNERCYLFIVTPFNCSFSSLETEAWFGSPFELAIDGVMTLKGHGQSIFVDWLGEHKSESCLPLLEGFFLMCTHLG